MSFAVCRNDNESSFKCSAFFLLCWSKIITHVLNTPSLSEILARFVLDCGVGGFLGICDSFCDFFVLFCFVVPALCDKIIDFIGFRQKVRLKGTSGFDEV